MDNEPQEKRDSETSMSPTDSLLFVHGELVRIEKHWTDQVERQANQIAGLPTVTGFLLAFLAAGGLQITAKEPRGWYLYPFYATLILLSFSLIFWALTLFQKIPIASASPTKTERNLTEWFRFGFRKLPSEKFAPEYLWLDSRKLWDKSQETPDALRFDAFLKELCESLANNAKGNLTHSKTQIQRRVLMNLQIAFILISLITLIVAVIGWAIAVL
jgi:hypothetical protein